MKRALEQGSEPPRRKRRLGHGPMRDPRLRVAVFVHPCDSAYMCKLLGSAGKLLGSGVRSEMVSGQDIIEGELSNYDAVYVPGGRVFKQQEVTSSAPSAPAL